MIHRCVSCVLMICFLSFSSQAAYADVLIQATSANTDEYMALIKTDDSVVSLVDELEKNRPDSAHTDVFLKKFERAQGFYLAGHDDEARRAFLEITATAHEADWRETQRQALVYSYLRLAQLSSDVGERENYSSLAARFAPDIAPDAQLFPPPLLKAYAQIRAREGKNVRVFSLGEKFPNYDVVIVDGRRYETLTETQLELTQGPHRITLLSNSRPPLTQSMTSSQLGVFKSDARPIAIGDCNEPALMGFQDLGLKTASVFYDRNCIRAFTGTSWLRAQNSEGGSLGSSAPPSEFERSLQTTAPKPAVSTRTMIWIGVGVALLTTTVLVIAHEHRGEKTVPSQTQGFSN